MRIQESGEMYLETIYVLEKERALVRAIDVAEHMGFSKPSVSRAIGLLKDALLVNSDKNGHLSLTDEGRAIAEKIYERHHVLTEFLVAIGVDREVAAEDACKLEHSVSDISLEAIKKHLSGIKNS